MLGTLKKVEVKEYTTKEGKKKFKKFKPSKLKKMLF